VSCSKDIAFLRKTVLEPLLNEQGRDIIITTHSAISLSYIVAGLVGDGKSLIGSFGGGYRSSQWIR
jgi:hypothetical protein